MPITCPIVFPRLSEAEMRAIDYRVMGIAFEIHRELGCLCDESVYHKRLATNLIDLGMQVACEVPVQLNFNTYSKLLLLDLVVNNSVVYELKATTKLTKSHVSQLLNYLFITNSSRGKLINFRPSSVESQFVNTSFDLAERRCFKTIKQKWNGPSDFMRLIVELIEDWGTGLDQAFYLEAIVYSLGGAEIVTKQVPMQINGDSLGYQRFHLLEGNAAFRLTSFQKPNIDNYEIALRKLMAPSPIASLHWINISKHEILLRTVER